MTLGSSPQSIKELGVTGKKLVIVESPAKAKTIGKYLGDDFEVQASVGHVRDLIEPKNLPPELKKGSLGKFSVDVDNGFTPYYVVSKEKTKTVSELKKALKDASELYLATDGDREGEAIAWHLLQVLKPKVPVHRMVFHEITRDAITNAVTHTRDVDQSLVDAQETRRILDRLYGYEVSPVLWRKIGPGLSAGRVQSAATRLVVERERERLAFVPASYWDVVAGFAPDAAAAAFDTRLVTVDDRHVASGRDFDDTGRLTSDSVVLTEQQAQQLAQQLTTENTSVSVSSVESKPYTRRPAAPFTTSTLQQEAGRKLKFSARQTMSIAQSLYENGYITYMRTDSTVLSQQAIDAARTYARTKYGEEFVPDSPRVYSGKSKNAQEAHEAIRPSGDAFRPPKDLAGTLSAPELKLYKLIFKRTVASQLKDATGSTLTARIAVGPTSTGTRAEFAASGTTITFRGFLKAYEEGTDDETEARDAAELPSLSVGQALQVKTAEAKGHETTPPARYTEASLVKELEELGIGRPSTYAAIISTILDRGYVTVKGQALIPSWTAFSVVRLLEQHFGNLVDYDFTAAMESDLDRIASGSEDRTDWLSGFYFGNSAKQGLRNVIDNLGEIDAREINSTPIDEGVTLRIGRYGPYLEVAPEPGSEATPRRVSLPPDMAPDELTPARAHELIDAPVAGDRVLGVNPETGRNVVVKDGRFGPYVTEMLPEGEEWPKGQKPPTASLFKSMSVETVTLDEAVELLGLPREVGIDPETSEPILAQNGRYGPYLKRGADTRTLPNEQAILTFTLDDALALYAQPKYGGRAAAAAIKEFDADPVSGKPIRIKDGRFGPYVTDGVTNVTVPKGETPEDVTFERAVELLSIKRAKGPAKRGTGATKKSVAKKPAAKKAATVKKAPTKKAPTKAAPRKASAATKSTGTRSSDDIQG